MPYQVEVGKKADGQLAELDAAIGASIERKILWLGGKCDEHCPSQARRNAG